MRSAFALTFLLVVPSVSFAQTEEMIKAIAKTFEDVRIGAAAVEAWGVKDCPFDLRGWFKMIQLLSDRGDLPDGEDPARYVGSMTAMQLRLGGELSKEARTNLGDVMK